MSQSLEKQLETARTRVRQQRAWIAKCGGNHAGYIAKYGANPDVDPLAIMEADRDRLAKLVDAELMLTYKLARRKPRQTRT